MQKKKSPITFTKKDVEIIKREKCYNGFFSIVNYYFRHRCFNGQMSNEITREIFERGQSAILLPYDPLRDEVVLIEQIRISAFDSSLTPWLLEVIAGIIEPGETPEQVVRREAFEESGLDVIRIKPIMNYLASPGGTSERVSVLVGEVNTSLVQGNHGIKKENEDIFVHVVTRQQAYCWVEEGIINNAASIIALQWLMLHYNELIQEWNYQIM
ncbi:ADP-ribose diphosphatase [Candidatus Pantoea carbekii]|uniref:ADP-ribose pyrophosphatase n=1 Tax=Candidatus Pantoea carbekii TaxID=1235990 RepID=U3U966_9GAMM|nr:ADP-ribose diphosphatase [Candidatus Pantoea carbekii]AKC32550.1 ADP-ribose pyrophosphatase NudF [Candidatus Pantoea carbekii]BAO00278.1 NudF protein [Candidatus Pantoea carbekii]